MVTYKDVISLGTFEERLEVLKTVELPSSVTFGDLRPMNQRFYASRIWKTLRREIIARDFGYDLAFPGREIVGKVLVHHIRPITPKDLYLGREVVMDRNNLITVSHMTHQAIHYGSEIVDTFVERKPGDTKLW